MLTGCRMECCYVFDHAVILMFVSACKQGEGRERKGEEEKEKGACRNGQCFRFPNAGN